jgi:hypothetical protein
MSEKFPLPEIKESPKKSERDIAEGEITQDGSTLSWKSNETIDKEAELLEYSLKKLKQTDEESKVNGTQKSSNIETKKTENFYIKPSIHTRTRQEVIKSGRKKTRSAQRKIISREPEAYEALLNQ